MSDLMAETPTHLLKSPSDSFCASNWRALGEILQPAVRVAWLPRQLSSEIRLCAEAFRKEEREPLVVSLRHTQRRNDLYRKFFRDTRDAKYQPLLADIEECLDCFWKVARARWMRVTIELPSDDNCRFFHSDNVELRLLCSYCGPGTLWLPEYRIRREKLGRGDNRLVVVGDEPPHQLPTEAIGIFKGDHFPGNHGKGAVHRSPPLEGQNPRLLLRVDAEGCRR